eukprot:CAMPEP_0115530254 /NCGR_PEP_ID=MMETSP0271-20121206/84395_1 /TAXON_ID=71861 /ORGANISM="Scrippsiella trochoidea, Strain CCMP3099" /LENGTH=57 /DNA_ID=CAMNT_0002962367 /DNA_START=55 /DNA_END=228 /DNA_ORIENTATION=-
MPQSSLPVSPVPLAREASSLIADSSPVKTSVPIGTSTTTAAVSDANSGPKELADAWR